ncbi:MAG: hypothetical protein SFT93_05875 [Rickettsiaceae bacterium]|nr:hypothetical protein [Rickettsiaceae bacterium]
MSYFGGAHYSRTSAEEKCRITGEELAKQKAGEEAIRKEFEKIGAEEGYKCGVLVGSLTALTSVLSIFAIDRIANFFSSVISSNQEKHIDLGQDLQQYSNQTSDSYYSCELGGLSYSNHSDSVD